MFPLIYGFILFTCQGWPSLASPVKYDQRQEGDINVQIDLKDVKIIALLKSDVLEDYMNYDYAYDYADFTIKPMVKPTKPPKTTTTATASAASDSLTTLSSSSILEDKTNKSYSFSTSATTLVTDNQVFENSSTTIENDTSSKKLKDENKPEIQFGKINATEEISSSVTEVLVEKPVLVHKQTKRCRAGFDKSGRCHRRRISLLPLAMKVAPELVRNMRQRLAH